MRINGSPRSRLKRTETVEPLALARLSTISLSPVLSDDNGIIKGRTAMKERVESENRYNYKTLHTFPNVNFIDGVSCCCNGLCTS